LGWNYGILDGSRWDSSFYKAIYRSVQDSKAAIRFLVDNASRYGIDTSKIFIGGISSGAVTALYTAYYNQADWDKEYPWMCKKLGYADSSTNNIKNKYTLKGVIDMWGGLRDTVNISASDARQMPIIIFHGTADTLVPYKNPPKIKTWSSVPVMGGYLIAQRFKHLGACYQLYSNVGGGHGQGFRTRLIADKIGLFCKGIFSGNCRTGELNIPH